MKDSSRYWNPARPPSRADALSAHGPLTVQTDHGQDFFFEEIAANMRANRLMRQTYAGKAYGLAAACLVAWIALLCAYGAIKVSLGVETWSDQVLIAITTGVTVSVLAAFLGVIRGLFPGKGKRTTRARQRHDGHASGARRAPAHAPSTPCTAMDNT